MTYELAKQLKDAGFPHPLDIEVMELGDGYFAELPNLSELIEAFGDEGRWELRKLEDGRFEFCHTKVTPMIEYGESPIEAVVKLWLVLNKKV